MKHIFNAYSIVMYGIYDSNTLEQLIDTVHKIHNQTTYNYLLVRLTIGINGIYLEMEEATMQ